MTTGAFKTDLLSLEEISFNKAGIENNSEFSELEKGKYIYNVSFGFTPGVNLSIKKFRIVFLCEITTLTQDEKVIPITGKFEIAFIFSIGNIDELITINDDEIQLDRNLLASVSNIVYSTARGIIYTRCQGTILHQVILPIMPTQKLVEMLTPSNPS